MAFVVPDAWARCVDTVDGDERVGHIVTALQENILRPYEDWPDAVKQLYYEDEWLVPQRITRRTLAQLGEEGDAADFSKYRYSNDPVPSDVYNNAPAVVDGIRKTDIAIWEAMHKFITRLRTFPNNDNHKTLDHIGTLSLVFCPVIWQAITMFKNGNADSVPPIPAHPDTPAVPVEWLTYGRNGVAAYLYTKQANRTEFSRMAEIMAKDADFMGRAINLLRNPPAGMAVPPREVRPGRNARPAERPGSRVNAPRTRGERAVLTEAQMSVFSNIEADLRSIGLGGSSGGKRSVRYTTRRRRLAKKKSTRGKRRS